MKISLPLHLRRQANLQLLVDEFGGVTALAGQVESPRPHLSAVLSGDKPCGNRLAAKIEAKTGRDPGWMDAAHDDAPAPIVMQLDFKEAAYELAKNIPDATMRDKYLNFLRGVEQLIAERQRIAESIADIDQR